MKTIRWQGPSDAVKLRVLRRDRFSCVYCGVVGTDAELEIDHIVPVSKGGSHHIGNLATACRSCNQKKSDGTLDRKWHVAKTGSSPIGLVGMFVVTLKEPSNEFGAVQYQGRILSAEEDTCLIERFSFLDGRRTDVIAMSKTDVLTPEKVRLFASWLEWRRFMFEDAEAARRKRGDPVGWHNGNFDRLIDQELPPSEKQCFDIQ